jgi:thiazole/oxazole-forming peptide maturase SagD family component
MISNTWESCFFTTNQEEKVMQNFSQPIAVLYGYSDSRNEISFLGRKGVVTLSGNTKEIKAILRRCNGLTTVSQIVRQLKDIRPEKILELLELCEVHGIVCDSRKLYRAFHEDSANPPSFAFDVGVKEVATIAASDRVRSREGVAVEMPNPGESNLLPLLRLRKSTREFLPEAITPDKFSGLLAATYGVVGNKWSVPSGGGLYPLDVYLVIPGDAQAFPQGVYRFVPESQSLLALQSEKIELWLGKVFNTKALLENVAGIICIAVNSSRPAAKYANRAYRLALLEAGHAAQNAYLYCAEQNIGIVEYGGFNDELVARELGLNYPEEAVLTALMVGVPDTSSNREKKSDQQMVEKSRQLRNALVGENKPILEVAFWEPAVEGYTMPDWAAVATYRPPGKLSAAVKNRSRATGTGSTSHEAVLKALAEGLERYALERRRSDVVSRATDLQDAYIDPRVIVPFEEKQLPFLKAVEPFSPDKPIDWVKGERLENGERVWVPADLVFYETRRRKPGSKVCYLANSSGVAAHFDKQAAVTTALYELVERDAFSVAWYGKRKVSALPKEMLPKGLRERIKKWEHFGYNVSLLNLTLDGPPVVLVMMWSEHRRPALCTGAGCRNSIVEAAIRAFDEAEFMAMTWQNRKAKRNMKADEVFSTEDHGLFYMDPKKLAHVAWLIEAKTAVPTVTDYRGTLNEYDPVVVDLTPEGVTGGLQVVRVLSEKLIPINFGYGSEHRGHPRMAMVGCSWGEEYPSIPHFFT